MPDFTVARRGTDSSGRGVYATNYMWSWWLNCCDILGFTPTVVQGAFMTKAGGGANDSAGYHDKGGCFDLRVWNLSSSQQTTTIRVLREQGAGAWLRDAAHGGMDPHIHFVLGTDYPLHSGAAWQWSEYKAGRDGLASRGRDYHPRPNPLVLTPPLEDPMADYAAQLDRIERKIDTAAAQDAARAKRIRQAIMQQIRALRAETKDQQILARLDKIAAALPEDDE